MGPLSVPSGGCSGRDAADSAITGLVGLESGLDDDRFSDDELTALALAAEPDPVVEPDAVPIALGPRFSSSMLGAWYMPAVAMHRSSGWRRPVVVALVATLVVLEALGLCSVFGQVVVG
ncbi:MAG: hypothetical protein JWO62_720 [Acidimicrobiaceae bacterium]|jgi:hypothetical protein|nr:hypothetical protein [Acidimicrobiaceae bacterium]